MIDLHCHSSFSDGALHPKDLIEKALLNKVRYLALTDHDTIEGLTSLHEAASSTSITIINGIELSTRWKKYDIHILGLNVNDCPQLSNLINQQNQSRILRAQQMGEALERLGINHAYEKACEIAGHLRVGRPHYAKLLINEGKARDMQMAFKQYLCSGKPAYVPTAWATVTEAVEAIVQSGGQAVIAHPLKYKLTRSKLHALIIEFKEAGGSALEVVSGQTTGPQIQEMVGLCLRFKLLASCGSDYHGDVASFISLGKQPKLPANCTPIWHDWTIGDLNDSVFCNTPG
jgi:predicted metal-dependent phosphoesterase TrpH